MCVYKKCACLCVGGVCLFVCGGVCLCVEVCVCVWEVCACLCVEVCVCMWRLCDVCGSMCVESSVIF